MKIVTAMLVCVLMACAAGGARAQDNKFPDVRDSSFVAANGERTMRQAIVVPADAHAVWLALSTADGWKGWAVATAYVDFREGGQIETNYQPERPQGDRDNIRNQIIAFVPDRMLVFRNVQAPTSFKNPEMFSQIVTTIRLEAIDATHTEVTISGAGYRAEPAFDDLYARFQWGNAYSLVELRKHFTASSQ